MNFKYFSLILGSLAIYACSDSLGTVGSSIQPESDKMDLTADTIYLNNRDSVYEVNSIYALSSSALLGNFTDKTYGDTRCDFLTEIHCNDNYANSNGFSIKKVYDDSLLYSTITLEFSSFTGDSLSPMQVSAYQLNNPLTKEISSNVDISKYCDKSIFLGKKTYTASYVGRSSSTTVDSIQIRMTPEFTRKFYDELKKNSSTFTDDASFRKFFPGIYLTTSYGSGSIIKVKTTSINLYYNYYYGRNYNDTKDSTYVTAAVLSNNDEVYLANHYINNHLSHFATNPTPGVSYLKTPAGLFDKIKLPMKQLKSKIGSGKLNGAKLIIHAERPDETKTALGAPSALLLMKQSDVSAFFANPSRTYESKKLAVADFNSTTNTYTFSNLSLLLNNYMNDATAYQGDDVHFALIPVSVTYDSSTGAVSSISHLNDPKAIKIYTTADKFYLSLVIAK